MKYFWTEAERRVRHTTCCFEFQKGSYSGKHRLDDSLVLHADIFDSAELYGIFSEAVGSFNYYYVTEIDKAAWEKLLELSRRKGGAAREIIEELAPWADRCLECEGVFTVCGI